MLSRNRLSRSRGSRFFLSRGDRKIAQGLGRTKKKKRRVRGQAKSPPFWSVKADGALGCEVCRDMGLGQKAVKSPSDHKGPHHHHKSRTEDLFSRRNRGMFFYCRYHHCRLLSKRPHEEIGAFHASPSRPPASSEHFFRSPSRFFGAAGGALALEGVRGAIESVGRGERSIIHPGARKGEPELSRNSQISSAERSGLERGHSPSFFPRGLRRKGTPVKGWASRILRVRNWR